MNKFLIMGRLCEDPQIRYTQSGSPMASFNFAVPRPFAKDGRRETDFFTCVAFGKTAENIERLHVSKGTKLLIDGTVTNDNYTDRNGIKRYSVRVVVNSFEFCEKKADTPRATPGAQLVAPPEEKDNFVDVPDDIDELLPFA